MRQFIYVQTRVRTTELSAPCAISIHAARVEAANEADAYRKGSDHVKVEAGPVLPTQTANDLVVAVAA